MEQDLMIKDEFLDSEDDDSAIEDLYLIFSSHDNDYGLPVRNVREIVALLPVTPVPDMPEYVRGVINLRGSVIPVLDIRLRLSGKETVYHDRTCVIIMQDERRTVGLIVDQVCEVLHISPADREPPPSIDEGISNRFIDELGKTANEVFVLLNPDQVFSDAESPPLANQEE